MDKNAESVKRPQAVLEQDFRLKVVIGSGFHQFLIDDRNVPLCQVFRGHGQFACGKEPAASFLGRRTRRAERKTQVTGWIGVAELGLIRVGDALHVERCKHLFLQKLQQRFAAGLLDDQSGNDIIRVAVLPLRPGLKNRAACAPRYPEFSVP